MSDCLIIAAYIIAALLVWAGIVSVFSLAMRIDEKSHILAAGLIPPAAAGIAVPVAFLALSCISAPFIRPDMPLPDHLIKFSWVVDFALYVVAARWLLGRTDRRLSGREKPPCPRSVWFFTLLSSVLTIPALFVLETGICLLPFLASGKLY